MKFNPNQPLSLHFNNINITNLVSSIVLLSCVFVLVFSIVSSLSNITKLNQSPQVTTPTQLLNQSKIQEATNLLQEHTLKFILE